MKTYGPFILVLGFFTQVRGFRITLDEKAQALCESHKYQMRCNKDRKICAVQHFDWPKNITIPVCIPLSYVPAQNLICQLPYDKGNCHARYIRWYYNIQAQKCTHFTYGGCNGNQNNFRSQKECEGMCLSTPRLIYDGGSALVQMKPSIMTAPIYQPPVSKKYEALNSVIANPQDSSYNRLQNRLRTGNRVRIGDETNTRKRRRLDKERAKERRRRERRKEKRRLRRLRRKRNKNKKGKKNRKNRKNKKRKNKKTEVEVDNETDRTGVDKDKEVTVPEMNNAIEDTEMDAADEPKGKRHKKDKKDKKRRKRRQRRKRRLEKEMRGKKVKKALLQSRRRYAEMMHRPDSKQSRTMFSLLGQSGENTNQNQQPSTLT